MVDFTLQDLSPLAAISGRVVRVYRFVCCFFLGGGGGDAQIVVLCAPVGIPKCRKTT